MITNREISSPALVDEALDEVVESARENGIPAAELARVFDERAAELRRNGDSTDLASESQR
ncbi:hypothetical protein [Halobaculum marinum]|uniref:Uncharacterized protein n=1 Tax=Halobaculum marinum TaxID=3031996 RepID=A0ABD5WY95_9EURY|nr:hypothetical protein [Halobaculum sp. DT55]